MGKFDEFVKTKNGKVLMAALAFVVVMAIAGGMYMATSRNSGAPVSGKPITAGAAAATQVAQAQLPSEPPEPMEPPVAVDAYTQEQFRDPFKPIETSATVGPVPGYSNVPAEHGIPVSLQQSGGSTTQSQAEGTLQLVSIQSTDGSKQAIVAYGGTNYTVGVGDRIGSSSYQIAEIGDTSVTVLFGDDRIVLSLGDSVTK